jgi:D-alanyl-lipoteichoic acid acyltransferase DltB (MBOAT superfamily)
MGSVLINYGFVRFMAWEKKIFWKKAILFIGICGKLGVIFFFKYFNFFIENVNAVFNTSYLTYNILMPLGISFFTFQQISYLVDSFRGETSTYSFVDYVLFVTFFPQLVAGPIVTHGEIIPQFNDVERKKFSSDELARGIYLFSAGLFKKVMIADTLGVGVDWGFAIPGKLSGIETFIVSLLYTLQIYFDFSGYCDMACGIAAMFHLNLPINFNSPYKAASIIEFWKRWHISLTRFLTKYVYYPLGGNRKGKCRTLINIMIVFLISGLWHGANWTYVLWGAVHGMAQIFNRIFKRLWDSVPRVLAWLATFIFVDLTWIIFRSESLTDCGILFRNLISMKTGGIGTGLIESFDIIELTYLEEHIEILQRLKAQIPGLNMWIVVTAALLIVLLGKNCYEKDFRPTWKNAMGSMVMLVWSVLSLSGLSSFLYFNF